jgi:predicted HicB family RNase H-like nuclease
MGRSSEDTSAKMFLRLPADLKSWVKREAERKERSLNSVVVRALREKMQSATMAAR